MSAAAAAPATRGLVALFKRGWNEIPEVVGSSFMGVLGLGLAFAGVYNYYSKDGDNRRFKSSIVVMRPEDPRAAKIRTD